MHPQTSRIKFKIKFSVSKKTPLSWISAQQLQTIFAYGAPQVLLKSMIYPDFKVNDLINRYLIPINLTFDLNFCDFDLKL
ncbi:hypothetical protein BpHYR1_001504 [Brachionus plicatilis]|uniref:Uncharacterized protein n=1 Tax=Brachionus plicatilis TaxID=10195 RepID=A0A3M7P7M1_BRAPC|nr:hypothetical protein BpHYR1_001504 [Brachionus plicatilis]